MKKFDMVVHQKLKDADIRETSETEEFSESDSNYIVVEHHVVEELQTIDDEEGGGGGENQDDISEGGQRYITHWTTKRTKE
ncbi:1718_t:CDS:2 [Entrophospora sp. SA101]|nr:1718_t:CDS:2 [Entrophospora sp. SA101]